MIPAQVFLRLDRMPLNDACNTSKLTGDNKEPAPTLGVLKLADSSVNVAVRPWVKTADYWDVFFATQESIKKRFDAEGICIPFPQQDVHLHKVD